MLGEIERVLSKVREWWRADMRAVLREELVSRERSLSNREVAAFLEWSLEQWRRFYQRDPVLSKKGIPGPDGEGSRWILSEVLDRLRELDKWPK